MIHSICIAKKASNVYTLKELDASYQQWMKEVPRPVATETMQSLLAKSCRIVAAVCLLYLTALPGLTWFRAEVPVWVRGGVVLQTLPAAASTHTVAMRVSGWDLAAARLEEVRGRVGLTDVVATVDYSRAPVYIFLTGVAAGWCGLGLSFLKSQGKLARVLWVLGPVGAVTGLGLLLDQWWDLVRWMRVGVDPPITFGRVVTPWLWAGIATAVIACLATAGFDVLRYRTRARA